ncbi:MAG: hypothetical protein KTR21_03945 [Rhodobacteraceae bacterium]|nr:hypothetical protein [Paracoccaceae bacterium]
MSDLHIFGVRHHGPGSSRRLAAALEAASPSIVLIEGPADATELLPMLADPDMTPPVALLAYAVDDPGRASFWPFAVYSPEYQAAIWAARRGVESRFIDWPASWRLAPEEEPTEPTQDAAGVVGPEPAPPERLVDRIRRDPIGVLARMAGYDDGESWWRDVVEENPGAVDDPNAVFAALEEAMSALRGEHEAGSGCLGEARPTDPAAIWAAQADRENRLREAHMRLEIARARRETEGAVAVVCGAWHAPALRLKVPAKNDRAEVKGRKKVRINTTWAPWTSARLAMGGGYGAGVAAPGWCGHLWETPREQLASRWLARAARALREKGHVVSTASLIEAERLAAALASMRGRPAVGFEELSDAVVSCLCFGEQLLWREVAASLLLGSEVGEVPENAPLAPLLADLQRQQRLVRLKPEALEKELSLDLRSDSGAAKSTLLHRLTILDVPWGEPKDPGGSRGTFRERWVLKWEPEFSVKLVEYLVYGSTVEQAAAGRLSAKMGETSDLGALAEATYAALTAQLPVAARAGVDRIGARAAQTSDCLELLNALPPMADVIRYGEARKSVGGPEATEGADLSALARRIATQSALTLPYAARGLDAAAAKAMGVAVKAADRAITLIELSGEDREAWSKALRTILADDQAARQVAGIAARLLYEGEEMTPEAAADLLGRMLSPGTSTLDAAAFFEGFFEGAGQRLIFDDALRGAVDSWVISLDGEAFTHNLPLFRRVLGSLDRTERRHLLDRLTGRQGGEAGLRLVEEHGVEGGEDWRRHFEIISTILGGAPEQGGRHE